jgi:hypothetical protein
MPTHNDTANPRYDTADVAALQTEGCASANESLNGQSKYTSFATAVQARDGGACRFSGITIPESLQKVHLIAYSRGFEVSRLQVRGKARKFTRIVRRRSSG